MVAGGMALGAYVWAAWPEAETRIVRLPYGEALPKQAPAERAARPSAPAPDLGEVAGVVDEAEVPEAEPVRVVAAAEPERVYLAPKPVGSAGEDDGYVESALQLGAEWLPGEGGGEPAVEAEDEGGSPVLGVIELPQPGGG